MKALLALLVAIGALVSAPAAQAQTDRFPYDFPTAPTNPAPGHRSLPLGVEVDLGTARGSDSINLYNVASTVDKDSYYDELGSSVADAFGVARSKRTIDTHMSDTGDSSTSKSGENNDITIDLDSRLAKREGDNLHLQFDAAVLRRVSRTWGFDGLELYACSNLPLTDASSRVADSIEGGCHVWRQLPGSTGIAAAPLMVDVTAHPKVADYWHLVGAFALVNLGLMLVFGGITRLLRRGFLATLGVGNLITIAGFVLLSALSWGLAAVILAVVGRPVDDFVSARDLGTGGHIVSVALPTLLFALPFLVSAIVLTGARPPRPKAPAVDADSPLAAQSPYGGPPASPASPPGVPSWLGATPPTPDAPIEHPASPSVEPQQPAQPPAEPGGDVPPSWHAPS